MTCYEKDIFSYYIILAFSKAALAQFGNCTASEMRTYVDNCDRQYYHYVDRHDEE